MLTRLLLVFPLMFFTALTVLFLPQWACILVLIFAIVFALLLNLHPDRFLLHFLQAREGTETEYPLAYRVAYNQAFKLKIPPPRLYTYSGFFHRAFALSAGRRSVFVVERGVLSGASATELEALWFALALQVHDKVAKRSTLALLTLAICWVPFLRILGGWRKPPLVLSWLGQYFVAPVASFLHRRAFGVNSGQRFLQKLSAFPFEEARLRELNARFTQPRLHLSVARDFTYRAGAAAHGPREQMILALESATHPLDFLEVTSLETAHA